MIQAAMKIKVHLRGVMMVRQWRGLHMAAYLSKDMAISSTISVPPTAWLKICVMQSSKEMTSCFLRSRKHLGCCNGAKYQINDREIGQEKIHGGMQVRVKSNSDNCEEVSCQTGHIEGT
jgi:hypothetical protein